MSKKELLKQHQKSNIRFQQGDFILYEPNDEQLERLTDLVKEVMVIHEDSRIEGSVELNSVKFIIRELTSIGDEIDTYSDEELVDLLENGDDQVHALLTGISELLHTVATNIILGYTEQIKLINQQVTIMNSEKDLSTLKNNVNRLFRENNVDVTFDDIAQLEHRQIEELLKTKITHK